MTLGAKRAQELVERCLSGSPAEQTEVMLLGYEHALTRFANNGIHQNVSERNVEVRVRAVDGTRVGVASTNALALESLDKVVASAHEVARHQPERPDFRGLPEPRPVSESDHFSSATASATPSRRAVGVKTVCDLAAEAGLSAAGSLSTGWTELVVANSLGVFAYDLSTAADFTCVLNGPEEATGYSAAVGTDDQDFDLEALAREAVDKALRNRSPEPLPAGQYRVLLDEYAVAEMLDYLAYIGFGALAVQEGQSFMAGRLGERLVSEKIDIWDDGLDPRGMPRPFDYEGVPKQKVSIIERGVARGVVYDSYTAQREGKQSTGHALPSPNTFGPFPMNLFLAPGSTPKARLVEVLDEGLWITRFHYVNVVHPREAVLTGMTRDGTFLVKRGQPVKAVRNLRFTQNVLKALEGAVALGDSLKPVGGFGGATLVPPMILDAFTFTGVSEQQ